MKKCLLLSFLFLFLCLGSCQKYDDSQINADISALQSRVTALESLCSQMNTNIVALQSVVNALQKNYYVSSVTALENGYKITFTNGESICIYNGKDGVDGKDGISPQISVKQGEDGVWYWTLNGEWLLDSNGNKIPTTGKNGEDGVDGKDGKDGVTPQLKIEDDYWYLSVDNGVTWTKLGKAKGEDGDTMISSISEDDDNVYIVLTDGNKFELPKKKPFNIKIDNSKTYILQGGRELDIPFELQYVGEDVDLTTICEGGLKASIKMKDKTSGVIIISVSNDFVSGRAVLLAASEGLASFKELYFEKGYLTIKDGKSPLSISKEGGSLSVTFNTNYEIFLEPSSSSKEWITKIETKSNDVIAEIFVAENKEYASRNGVVYIKNMDAILDSLQIVQDGGARLSLSKNRMDESYGQHSITVDVSANTSYSYYIAEGSAWISYEKAQNGTYQFGLSKNASGTAREGRIVFVTDDGAAKDSVIINQISLNVVKSITVEGGCGCYIGSYYSVTVSYSPADADVDFEWQSSCDRVARIVSSSKGSAKILTGDYGKAEIVYTDKNTGLSGSTSFRTMVTDFSWNNPSASSTYSGYPMYELAVGDSFQLKWNCSPYTEYLFCNQSDWVFYEPTTVVGSPTHISISETGEVKGISVGKTGMKATGFIIGSKDRVYFSVVSEYSEKEPNNDFPYATTMKSGFPMAFTIATTTDVDVLKFSTDKSYVDIDINYFGNDSGADKHLRWEMYNSSCTLLGSGTLSLNASGDSVTLTNKFINTAEGYLKFYFPTNWYSYPETRPSEKLTVKVY